jgi:hypothetical protein
MQAVSVFASPRRRLSLFAAVATIATTGAMVGLTPGIASASSHREAPLTAADPKIDNTDVYAFVSKDKTDSVTLIANWIPNEEPNGGPNFYPWQAGAHYDINIDNNGDGKADVVYRWVFKDVDKRGNKTFLYNNGPVTSLGDPNLLFKQTYTLTEIDKNTGKSRVLTNGVSAPSFAGKVSMPNYPKLRAEAVKSFNDPTSFDGHKTFAGQADDPFFLDLRVFDLLYGTHLQETGQDTLCGYNVNTIALQVPKSDLALRNNAADNPVVGIWSTTEKQTLKLTAGAATPTGPFVQVSRLGNPLVNEVVVPAGLKDAFNAITPDVDHTVTPVVNRVLDPEVPKLIQAIYGVPAPKTPREDLFEIFLTGIAKNAPTSNGSKAPIQADLNSQLLNKNANPDLFTPAEELRLNMSIAPTAKPNRLGVLANDFQGFPNGRRLADDVVDIELQALEGAATNGIVKALADGDRVNTNDHPFGTSFPYVAQPNMKAVNRAACMNNMPATGTQAAAFGATAGSSTGTGAGAQTSLLPAAGGIAGLTLFGLGIATLRRRRSAVATAQLS